MKKGDIIVRVKKGTQYGVNAPLGKMYKIVSVTTIASGFYGKKGTNSERVYYAGGWWMDEGEYRKATLFEKLQYEAGIKETTIQVIEDYEIY